MNPMMLIKLKDKINIFQKEHPRMLPFFETIDRQFLSEGSVVELKVISADGRDIVSNIKVTENDMELVKTISQLAH